MSSPRGARHKISGYESQESVQTFPKGQWTSHLCIPIVLIGNNHQPVDRDSGWWGTQNSGFAEEKS